MGTNDNGIVLETLKCFFSCCTSLSYWAYARCVSRGAARLVTPLSLPVVGEFKCADGRRCLPMDQVCDGKPHCPDHSDESDCWKPSKSCQHRCDDNKRCLPKSFLCDGERDCQDGSDESNCGRNPMGPLFSDRFSLHID